MNNADHLWTKVFWSFSFHRKESDLDEQSALDRIAMKCLGLTERKSFNPKNCAIKEIELSGRDLAAIQVYHDRNTPIKIEGPIVLLLYNKLLYVIEGNTRTNAWRKGKFSGPFTAILLEPLF